MNIINSLIWRAVRTAASVGIATAVMAVTNNPKWIWLAPLITAAGKALRDKFGLKNIPL